MRLIFTLSACLLLAGAGQVDASLATTWSGTDPTYAGSFAGGTVTASVSGADMSNITDVARPGWGVPANSPFTPLSLVLPLGVSEVITAMDTSNDGAAITLDFTGTTFEETDRLFVGNINIEDSIELRAENAGGPVSVTWTPEETLNGNTASVVVSAPAAGPDFESTISGGALTTNASALWLNPSVGDLTKIKISWTGSSGGQVIQAGVAVPEPSSFAFLGLIGVVGIGFRCWRKKAND